jgi:hypothetical protein
MLTIAIAACSPSIKGTEDVTVIETADGAITYKAGPDMANFSQLQVGDQVTAVLTGEVAVSIGSGEATLPTGGGAVAFQLADGTTKTVKAGRKVDVDILKVGDSVSIQVGQGVLITAEKP